MAYWYAIGPVAQSTDAVDGTYYHAPKGCIGWIDTRPITPGSVASGFFAFSEFPAHLKETHAIVGDGHRLEEYYPDATERSAWEAAFGVKTDASWTLVQALRQLLFVDADPEGAARCLPGTPTHRGVLELHLGGHSRVWTERFTGRDHDAWPVLQRLQTANMARLLAEQTAEADRIRRAKPTDDLGKRIAEIAQKRGGGASYAEVREELAKAAEALPGKALTDVCRLYRCDPADVLPLGVEVERRKPETAVSDDFNRSDGAIGANWTARTDGTFSVASNQLQFGGTASNISASRNVHHATTLSGQAHWAQIVSTNADAGWVGPLVRGNGSDHKCYTAYIRYASNARVLRYINGTGSATSLWNDTGSSSGNVTIKLSADGSSISLYQGTTELTTQTNSNATGLSVGFNTHPSLSSPSTRGDDFSGADLLAAAVVIPVPLLMLRA